MKVRGATYRSCFLACRRREREIRYGRTRKTPKKVEGLFFFLAEETDAMTYCGIFALVVICRRKNNGGDLSQPNNREEK